MPTEMHHYETGGPPPACRSGRRRWSCAAAAFWRFASEIAPDVHVRVARRAVTAVLTEEDDELEELERAQQEAKEEVLAARDAGEQ